MKRQIRILAIVLCLLGGTATMFAQHKHEFSVYGGSGLSTLNYTVTTGEHKAGLGGHFGLGYHYFFSPKWGLGTGAELAIYNAKYNNMNNLNVRSTLAVGAQPINPVNELLQVRSLCRSNGLFPFWG